MTFVDAQNVLLIYNQQQPRNVVVQRSTDGGLTYGPHAVRAARNPRFPGPIRYIEPMRGAPERARVLPVGPRRPDGNQINISFSTGPGRDVANCGGAVAPGTTTLFATADHDSGREHLHRLRREREVPHVHDHDERREAHRDVATRPDATTALPPLRAGLFTAPVQVDRDAVRSTVFQWVTAGGAPGRVAVVFAGTETDGNPNTGTFNATWDIYVNQSLNGDAPRARRSARSRRRRTRSTTTRSA